MGLSGAGKTTLGKALNNALDLKGIRNCLLDGDRLRGGINSDLGFSAVDRIENVRRVAHIASICEDAGIVPIVAIITPLEEQRIVIKQILKEKLCLVYLDCSLEISIQRDPKGLYHRAIKNEITNFTGIGSPFEIPGSPNLIINSGESELESCLTTLMDFILPLIDS